MSADQPASFAHLPTRQALTYGGTLKVKEASVNPKNTLIYWGVLSWWLLKALGVAIQPTKTLQLLSDRLKELRKRHRLTQESLAQMSGIAYKYYQDIEGCRRDNLELQTIEKIAGVFGIDAYQLFADRLPVTKLRRMLEASAPHKSRRVAIDVKAGAAKRK